MKLAKIILPLLDNSGRDLFYEHQQLQKELLEIWGGFTRIEGAGQWKSPGGKVYAENVMIYEVAMGHSDAIHLRALAERVATYARQQSVMVVLPSGEVEFIHSMKVADVARIS